jgi:hypothetical protein
MAARSKTKGTPEYKRRQARIAARRSTKPVGASLDPETMGQYINEYYEEQGLRAQHHDALQDTLINDPLERQKIGREFTGGAIQRVQGLAERGLSARGYDAGDLSDLTRTKVEATKAQDLAVRTAQNKYDAAIQELNTRRTALDKNYAAIAGRNIQAGTGIYKNRKPAGWTPPSLPTTAPGGGSGAAPPTVGGTAPAPKTPTGARPSTTSSAVDFAKRVVSNAPKLANPARRRVRAA